MKPTIRLVMLFGLGALLLAVLPASATIVDRGYSGNGESLFSTPSLTYSVCLISSSNCMDFQTDTFLFGTTTVSGFDFTAEPTTGPTLNNDVCGNSNTSGCVDVFQLT